MLPSLRTTSLDLQGSLRVRVTGKNHINDSTLGYVSEVTRVGCTDRWAEYGKFPVNYQIILVVDPHNYPGMPIDVPGIRRQMQILASEPVSWSEPFDQLAVMWARTILTHVTTENARLRILECTLTLSPSPHEAKYSAHFVHSLQSQSAALRLVA